jgi:parvulin-like peptidyl-prolyl isomerase
MNRLPFLGMALTAAVLGCSSGSPHLTASPESSPRVLGQSPSEPKPLPTLQKARAPLTGSSFASEKPTATAATLAPPEAKANTAPPPTSAHLAPPAAPSVSRPVDPIPTQVRQPRNPIRRTQFVPAHPGLKSAIGGEFGLPEPRGSIRASVVARVNGEPILFEEIENLTEPQRQELQAKVPASQYPLYETKLLREALEQVIDREIIYQEAKSQIRPQFMEKIKEIADKEFDTNMRKRKEQMKFSDEELRYFLHKQGTSYEEQRRLFQRNFIAQEFMRNQVRGKIETIEREQLLDYYYRNKHEFEKTEQVFWQHIYIDAERFKTSGEARRQAEQVHRAVQACRTKEEFAALADKHSHGLAWRKGEGEGTERGQIRPPEVEDIVFGLKAGEVGPLIEARLGSSSAVRGYHIVRVVDHQAAGKVAFEAAVKDITRKIQNKNFQTEYTRIMKELRAKAYIENALIEE